MGFEVEERLQFFPTSSSMARQKNRREQGGGFFWPSLWTFLCYLVGELYHLGTDGRGGQTTSGKDSGQQTEKCVYRHDLSIIGRMQWINKKRGMS